MKKNYYKIAIERYFSTPVPYFLIGTVPLMLYSQTRPEDLDTALEDHVCDEWRYFCMSRPVRPIRGGQTAAIWSDPLDQLR